MIIEVEFPSLSSFGHVSARTIVCKKGQTNVSFSSRSEEESQQPPQTAPTAAKGLPHPGPVGTEGRSGTVHHSDREEWDERR